MFYVSFAADAALRRAVHADARYAAGTSLFTDADTPLTLTLRDTLPRRVDCA